MPIQKMNSRKESMMANSPRFISRSPFTCGVSAGPMNTRWNIHSR